MKHKGFKIFLLILFFVLIGVGLYVIASSFLKNTVKEDVSETATEYLAAVPKAELRTTEEEVIQDSETTGGFYFEQLGESEKVIYQALYEGCGEYRSKIDIGAPLQSLYIAAFALINDHPEFYWADRYSVSYAGDTAVAVEYEVPDDAGAVIAKIKNRAEQIVDRAPEGADSYELIRYFYEWIINNTDYGYSEDDQNMKSVFLDKVSVCAGYSKAFLYLCNIADIECAYVRGLARESNHAWNLVKLDGEYYWVDVTWGDPVFIEAEKMAESGSAMNYNYLCVTDDELFRNHTIDLTLSSQGDIDFDRIFSFPECRDTSLNYYRMEGAYFEYYDSEELVSYIGEKLSEGNNENIEMMFGTYEDYTEAYNGMFSSDDSIVTHAIETGLPDFYGNYYCEYSSNEDLYYIVVSVFTDN